MTHTASGPSDELRVFLRPFAGYRGILTRSPDATGAWTLLRRPLKWLLVAAAFLSFTTAGRLVWFHLLFTAMVWWVVAAAQVVLVALVARVLRSPRPVSQLVDLYFVGQGPWYLLLMVGAGICLFVPDVFDSYLWLSRVGVVGLLTAIAAGWTVLLAVAYFRVVFRRSIGGALLWTVVFYALYAAIILGIHWSLDQIQPLIGGPS